MVHTQGYQLIVLQPQGRLDLQRCPILEKQMISLVPGHHNLLVIDLEQVNFMDSYGLVTLIKGLKAARVSRCRLVLCNLQASVRLVFELTQMDSVFEIFESYDAVMTTVDNLVAA
jgi:anti-anti-sigma factor